MEKASKKSLDPPSRWQIGVHYTVFYTFVKSNLPLSPGNTFQDPNGHLKSQIVPILVCTTFFPIYAYI